jgi:Arm DNA-binding domain
MTDIDKLISKTNERLKFTGVTIKREGKRLVFRAKFPPKPNGVSADRLNIGWHATPELIKKAEALARKISGEIDLGIFDWEEYLKSTTTTTTTTQLSQPRQMELNAKGVSQILTAREWAEKFEEDYFHRRERNNKSISTWTVEYQTVFKNLPASEPLTSALLKDLALTTKPDTRTRKRYCMCLNAIAKFAGIDIDLKPYSGNYGINSVKRRELPEDILIAQQFHKIQHPGWKWVYGMVACFGLRNYEPFRVDIREFRQNPSTCILTDSKTGPRIISPYYPEWIEEFDLANIRLPLLNRERANRDLGGEGARYFKSMNLPFTLKDMRHAWAIRTLIFELDISWAARMMGHSVKIHSDVYHHWISQKQMLAAHNKAIANTNRPLPPVVEISQKSITDYQYTDDRDVLLIDGDLDS